MIQKQILKKIAEKALKKRIANAAERAQHNSSEEPIKGTKKVLQSGFIVKDFEDFKSKALTAVFVVGGSYASWRFLIKPKWEEYKKNQENEKIFSDPNAQQASILRQAIIGSGTDEATIMKIAKKITDWKAVQKSYQKITGNNLNEDLKGDLSSKEYNLFLSIVNRNIKIKQGGSKRGFIVVSSKAVRLRNTPDSTIGAYSFNTNVLGTVKARILLGFASGNIKVDSKGVQYYEVRIKFTEAVPYSHNAIYRKQGTKTLVFWVGAGAIELYSSFKQLREKNPSVVLVKGTKDTGLRSN